MVNGHLSPEIEMGGSDSRYRQSKLLFRNLHNGHFQDVSAQSIVGPALHSSRGAASADILNDGRTAIAVNEMHEHPSLLMLRDKPDGHWLEVKTVGTRSNRDGIGALIRIEAAGVQQVDEVRSGGSYLSQSDLTLHFGLGSCRTVDDITITWPSGVVDHLKKIASDRKIIVKEGSTVNQESRTSER